MRFGWLPVEIPRIWTKRIPCCEESHTIRGWRLIYRQRDGGEMHHWVWPTQWWHRLRWGKLIELED